MPSLSSRNGREVELLRVEADGMETQSPADSHGKFQVFARIGPSREDAPYEESATGDTLVDLFREKYQIPVETFMQELREQRQTEATHSS